MALINQLEGRLSDEIKARIEEIRTLCYGLIASVEEYYLGHVNKSYQHFKESTGLVKKYLSLQHQFVLYNEQTTQILEQFYFKARIGLATSYSNKEMFIRPFEQREDILTYRYSIPGLPCLYLSNNVLTAWYELDCPDINTLQISRFELHNQLKKLYFGDQRKLLVYSNSEKTESDRNIINYFTYFPLHAVCTIKTKNKNSIFKPEYIFPQLLMQWLHDEDIDMIEYMSTKVNSNQINGLGSFQFNNIAIPAKSFAKEGVCESLKASIKVTEPISWQNLNITIPHFATALNAHSNDMNFYKLFRRQLNLELIKGISSRYDSSIFGMLEDYLISKMNATNIT